MSDNVIQIGDLRIRRQKERHWSSDKRCAHHSMTWDDNGCIVTCDDCNMQIQPYWAMQLLAHHYERAFETVNSRARQLADERAQDLHRLASKKVDAVWRTRNMVPCCPHCGHGILPEDGLGSSQMGRQFELRRRQKPKPPTPPASTPQEVPDA